MGDLRNLAEYLYSTKDRGLPWAFGYDVKKASIKAKEAWAILRLEEKLGISRHNPFRKERNQTIVELYQRGLAQKILCDLTGLSLTAIERIVRGARAKRRFEGGIEIS